MKDHVKFLKTFKKDLVANIRGNVNIKHGEGIDTRWLVNSSYWFRHVHIADCLLRGRTMEQIEHKNREGNEPNQWLIDLFMNEDMEFPRSKLHMKRQFDTYTNWKEAQDANTTAG